MKTHTWVRGGISLNGGPTKTCEKCGENPASAIKMTVYLCRGCFKRFKNLDHYKIYLKRKEKKLDMWNEEGKIENEESYENRKKGCCERMNNANKEITKLKEIAN